MKYIVSVLFMLISKFLDQTDTLFLQNTQSIEASPTWKTLDGQPTVLYAHRGDPVFLPSHTLPAYEIAAINRADYIETDLVLTKDGILVCFHDVTLKSETDIANHPEFDHLIRNGTALISGANTTFTNDWFVQDFTLAQLKTLRVVQQRIGIRPAHFNGLYTIPTFQEYLDLVHKMTFTLDQKFGIIPELKYPPFLNQNSTERTMADIFLETLEQNGYALKRSARSSCYARVIGEYHSVPCPHVIIQSFDQPVLKYLSSQTDLDLMMLVYRDPSPLTYKLMEDLSRFVKYYCLYKEFIYVGAEAQAAIDDNVEYDKELIESLGGFVPANQLVSVAHKLGMKMTVFTVHDSREPSLRGCARSTGCEADDVKAELYYFFKMGLDAMFVENIPEKRELRQEFDLNTERIKFDIYPRYENERPYFF